jgi:hypothetical protein
MSRLHYVHPSSTSFIVNAALRVKVGAGGRMGNPIEHDVYQTCVDPAPLQHNFAHPASFDNVNCAYPRVGYVRFVVCINLK